MPQHPVFMIYKRDWLSEATGYSMGYLCRMATGKTPLNRYFIERMAFALQQHPSELFLAKALEANLPHQHQEKKRRAIGNFVSGAKDR